MWVYEPGDQGGIVCKSDLGTNAEKGSFHTDHPFTFRSEGVGTHGVQHVEPPDPPPGSARRGRSCSAGRLRRSPDRRWCSMQGPDGGGVLGLAVPLFAYVSMAGLIIANSVAGALGISSQRAGVASALVGSIGFGMGGLGLPWWAGSPTALPGPWDGWSAGRASTAFWRR